MVMLRGRDTEKRKTRAGEPRKRFDSGMPLRKRVCRFCKDGTKALDYKDVKRLERFLTDRGKIFSSRLSGNCARHQRMLAEVLKRARFMALLPYVKA